ncbi:RHS repeat-associated core domain-containing protein [Marininema halotolerans]|uniref:RHS repeat-associated core domain-containing protein n=2 Tax=Marininema halotolerans TaxID=1155944 RepID=A0A1I6PMI3_9BACL|nr:RHS repeat-associated core domain-containing protein [Marininema halotolerans]
MYNPYRYTAKRWDPDAESYDMGFRNYDPSIARFDTRDAYSDASQDLGLAMDMATGSRYAFAGGNPVSYSELDGHIPDLTSRGDPDAAATWVAVTGTFYNPRTGHGRKAPKKTVRRARKSSRAYQAHSHRSRSSNSKSSSSSNSKPKPKPKPKAPRVSLDTKGWLDYIVGLNIFKVEIAYATEDTSIGGGGGQSIGPAGRVGAGGVGSGGGGGGRVVGRWRVKSPEVARTRTGYIRLDRFPKAKNHSVWSERVYNQLPARGQKPNSSMDWIDKRGNLDTRRYFDENGDAILDIDFSNHGHPKYHPVVPHAHDWDWTIKGDPRSGWRIP